MPTQRLSMRRIRDVLRLRHAQGLTERLIARTLGVSNGVVHSYLRRARVAGLPWPLPDELDDEALERLLFPPPAPAAETPRRPVPDCEACGPLRLELTELQHVGQESDRGGLAQAWDAREDGQAIREGLV